MLFQDYYNNRCSLVVPQSPWKRIQFDSLITSVQGAGDRNRRSILDLAFVFRYFLASGYAVIFLHRAKSLKPFERRFSKCNPLEWFTMSEDGGKMEVKYCGPPDVERQLLQTLPLYSQTQREGSLLCIPFTTVFQYLFYLRELGLALQPLGKQAIIYLAAAVSDFYIAPSHLSNHKIQSSSKLEVEFSNTPKMVLPLVSQWAPEAFTVTFKLESDETVLLPHAKLALLRYGHQVVIANLLATHRTTVTIVSRGDSKASPCDEGVVGEENTEWEALRVQLSRDDLARDIELESLIIADLTIRHKHYL